MQNIRFTGRSQWPRLTRLTRLLIDEARVPLVIAGGESEQARLVHRVHSLVRCFRRTFRYSVDECGRNIALTDAGIRTVEDVFGCGNLFAEENWRLLEAVQNSLHAHALFRQDSRKPRWTSQPRGGC